MIRIFIQTLQQLSSAGILLLFFCLTTVASWSQQLTQTDDLALVGAKLYIAPIIAPVLDGTVLVQHGKITAVGSRRQIRIPKDIKQLNCSGLVMTAGFWNCHVHFMEPKWQRADSLTATQLSQQMETMLTQYGFT